MLNETDLHAKAADIIKIAMGRQRIKRKMVWCANEDPLALWMGVQEIVSLVQEYGYGKVNNGK